MNIVLESKNNQIRYEQVTESNMNLAYKIQKNVWKNYPDYNNFVNKAKNTTEDNVSFIIYVNDIVIGITGVYVDEKYSDSIWLDWFCILPEYRKRGYGKQVLIDTIEYARNLNRFLYFRIETTYYKDRPAIFLYDKVMPFKEKYTMEDTDEFSYNRLIYTYNFTPKIEMWDNRYLGLNDYYMVDVTLAVEEDIEELSKLRVMQQKDDWDDNYIDKYDLRKTTKDYLSNHLNKDLYIFIVKNNNNIIATCGLQIIKKLPQCNDNGLEGYVCNVFTKKEFRNKGIQTKVLKKCIQFAKEKQINLLSLSSDNEIAINIYKKFGFNFDKLAMKLKL